MPTKFYPFTDDPQIGPGLDIAGNTNAGINSPDFFNCYFDVYQNAIEDRRKFRLIERFNTKDNSLSLGTTNADQVINGIISSLNRSKAYFVLTGTGGPLFKYFDGTTVNNIGGPAGWSNTQGTVFSHLDGISYGANALITATDFNKGAILSDVGVWTEITDADYTGISSKTNLVGMDGYLFCGSGTTNKIHNSDLNSAGGWTATSFLLAADTPGTLLWLSKIRNYLIAFKQNSVEFFENVGNPTPGSPLEPQKQLNRKIGLYTTSSVQEVSDGIIFAGITPKGKVSIFKIERDTLAIKEIANPLVQYGLNNYTVTTDFFSSYTNYMKVGGTVGSSQIINFKHKEFYTITITTSTSSLQTQVYDNKLGVWTRWYSNYAQTGGQDGWFLPSQCIILRLSSSYLGPVFIKNYGNIGTTFATKLQTVDFQGSSPITAIGVSVGFTTDFIDLGTSKRKFIDSIELIYEFEDTQGTPSELDAGRIAMKYWNKSFKSTSSSVSTVTYKDTGLSRIIFRRLGNFQGGRAFTFYTDPTFNTGSSSFPIITILGIDINYNEGETEE